MFSPELLLQYYICWRGPRFRQPLAYSTRIFEIQTTEFPKNIMLERINCFLTHNSR